MPRDLIPPATHDRWRRTKRPRCPKPWWFRRPPVPATLAALGQTTREAVPWGVLQVITRGDQVWVRHETCAICARQMGRATLFVPARLADAQLASMQRTLGLPEQPALRSPQAWLERLRARPGARCEP